MSKKKETEPSGEQIDLIDVAPKNAKPIIEAARLYKKYQAARQTALVKEIDQKHVILELVKKAGLQTLAGGKVKFEYDGVMICVTPRDELITVKDKAVAEEE